jgi:hypothetical protein
LLFALLFSLPASHCILSHTLKLHTKEWMYYYVCRTNVFGTRHELEFSLSRHIAQVDRAMSLPSQHTSRNRGLGLAGVVVGNIIFFFFFFFSFYGALQKDSRESRILVRWLLASLSSDVLVAHPTSRSGARLVQSSQKT